MRLRLMIAAEIVRRFCSEMLEEECFLLPVKTPEQCHRPNHRAQSR